MSRELDLLIASDGVLTFGISREMLEQVDLGSVAAVINRAAETDRIFDLVGRIAVFFPEYDTDKREVFEVPEIKAWLHALEERHPYLSVLLEPSSFKILMYTRIPWKREGLIKKQIVGDPEATMGFILESGMTAFRFATWQNADAKKLASKHLRELGLGDVVTPGLLDDYERAYKEEA